MTSVRKTAHHILPTTEGIVHMSAFCGPVAVTCVGLQIEHGGLQFCLLQISDIVLHIKLSEKRLIPIFNVHIHKVSAVAVLIPGVIHCEASFYDRFSAFNIHHGRAACQSVSGKGLQIITLFQMLLDGKV